MAWQERLVYNLIMGNFQQKVRHCDLIITKFYDIFLVVSHLYMHNAYMVTTHETKTLIQVKLTLKKKIYCRPENLQ